MTQPLLNRISESYPVVARDLLNPLLELLRASREHCGGDVDKFLVLLVVGIRTAEHPEFARHTQAELLSGEVPVFPGLGTNVRSIAESLGIARETVRRKVSELVDDGWLHRHGRSLYFTALAYRKLVPVRESLERMAVRNFETVRGILEEPADV